jgi:hypothetical protein
MNKKLTPTVATLLLVILAQAPCPGAEPPLTGTAENPIIYFEVERKPTVEMPAETGKQVYRGVFVHQEGADYAAPVPEGTAVAHHGFGSWDAWFRCELSSPPRSGPYTFWTRWMQGGDPGLCKQQFQILAGPNAESLEERGSCVLGYDAGWKLQWAFGEKAVSLKSDDKVIEIRNSGPGDGAKVFDAFVLSPGQPPEAEPTKVMTGEITVGEDSEPVKLPDLPVQGTLERPLILLQVGRGSIKPPESAGPAVVCPGEVTAHEGDAGIRVTQHEVTSHRSGAGPWIIQFRFELPETHPSGLYTFWPLWKQGGDPAVSTQEFEVWAGPAADTLEKRSIMHLKPSGWSYEWQPGAPVVVKPEDRVLEVRNKGEGMTAKVFALFLLGGPKPPPKLPVTASPEKPVVVLGFGTHPLRQPGADPGILAFTGAISSTDNADSGVITEDAAVIMHKDFGRWAATFDFPLDEPVPAAFYKVHARYMTGGEPSQVAQTFVVKAGPDKEHLGVRGSFTLLNDKPFTYQWMASDVSVPLFASDRIIQIFNDGKAHAAKSFSGFVLEKAKAMPAWLNAEKAALRSRFFSRIRAAENPARSLLLVDGDGPDAVLFEGLNDGDPAWYDQTNAQWLVGDEAEQMKKWLNLPGTPAAVIINKEQVVAGVLHDPQTAGQVRAFLKEPSGRGILPHYPERAAAGEMPLKNGVPDAWLVCTGWVGRCGIGSYGLDAESDQRPKPGDIFAYDFYTAGKRMGSWERRETRPTGDCLIQEKLGESYSWGRGTSYAVIYVNASTTSDVDFSIRHTGVESAVYLDGLHQPLQAAKAGFHLPKSEESTVQTEERAGQEVHKDIVRKAPGEQPKKATLHLEKGPHCLVLKLVHAQRKGESVAFGARFSNRDGSSPSQITSSVEDPQVVHGLAESISRLWPTVYLEEIPANLPFPGDSLRVIVNMTPNVFPVANAWTKAPYLPFDAILRLRLTDYSGKVLKTVDTRAAFPATVKVDLGKAPGPGYYAIIPSVHHPDGRLLHRFPSDGFSVIRGTVAQRERLEKKKLWLSYYYVTSDNWESNATWLERTGVLKAIGSQPGCPDELIPKLEEAKRRGLILFGDFAGDSAWMNNSEVDAKKVIATLPKYTRYFKTVNEVDGKGGPEWLAARTPKTWLERAKWQHQAVHKARPDAVYLGGSLYCSGVDQARPAPDLGPRAWFRECLKLGLHDYVDAWDVHAYPQRPPDLEGDIANSPDESELGVLSVFKELKMKNDRPFWLGETGALPWHGFRGLRFQAEATAKLIAWANSRKDFHAVAFCAAQFYRRIQSVDYAMAHEPGEAALYTAGALIDGLPYKRSNSGDRNVQAAYFGATFMIWRNDERWTAWKMRPEGDGPFVLVDVVGNASRLDVRNGEAEFPVGPSPVYVLTQANYELLTRKE